MASCSASPAYFATEEEIAAKKAELKIVKSEIEQKKQELAEQLRELTAGLFRRLRSLSIRVLNAILCLFLCSVPGVRVIAGGGTSPRSAHRDH